MPHEKWQHTLANRFAPSEQQESINKVAVKHISLVLS
jgi:hypothetical protein